MNHRPADAPIAAAIGAVFGLVLGAAIAYFLTLGVCKAIDVGFSTDIQVYSSLIGGVVGAIGVGWLSYVGAHHDDDSRKNDLL